jgi:hypothetical protein
MRNGDIAEWLTRMEDLLASERRALRFGEFGQLAYLAEAKTQLSYRIDGLAAGPTSILPKLERLRARAAENQRLLAAAMKGVRSAQHRLDMIRRAGQSLNTYDKLGRKRPLGAAPGTVERRA